PAGLCCVGAAEKLTLNLIEIIGTRRMVSALDPTRSRRIPMDLDTLFEDPVRRRGWLLEKALECHSLSEAVALAKSAEEFLSAAEVVDPVGRPHPARDEAAVELTAGGVQGADNNKLSVSGGADTLAVMAVVEDVVQYLRQRGASVLPKDHGTFL